MTELLTMIILIAGAIGGLARTLYQHEGKLVWPSVDVKRWRIQLGFPLSMIIGAGVSWLTASGVITVFPSITPDDLYESILFGFIIGFISLHLINRLLGTRLDDPDNIVVGGRLIPNEEKNIHVKTMYSVIESEAGNYVERVNIMRGKVPGIVRAVVVPRKDVDPNKAKMMVENIMNRYVCPSTHVYVRLPEEVIIDISLVVEVMDGEDPEFTRTSFSERIKNILVEHINSLRPGESVYRSQIVHKVVGLDKYIKDVRGEKLSTVPETVEGRIPIGPLQVARAGNIDVTIDIRMIQSTF